VRLGPPAKVDMIHASTCRHAAADNALRWVWADQQGFENIDWDALRRHGIRACRRCHPELLRSAHRSAKG
jgi:lactate dehydrogenase-like 2-hydroxyacid dehydrogenase